VAEQSNNELLSAPMGNGVMQVLMRARHVWGALPANRRNTLIAGVAVLMAVCAAVTWWGTRVDWKTLYSGMEARDLQQVEGELAAGGVTYQTSSDGTGVEVPAELLDKARMEVASKGMPQSGRMGFELFDKPNWVGSEFDEKVNYQRALEGELEHTIATLSSVRSARVHLVLPKESLFTDQAEVAKASVVMKLKSGSMPREEVDSIRNLVSGAVEGLSADHVTLVDADGRVNLNSPGQSEEASDAEQELSNKLVAMLEPLAGRENVRASVTIGYDQSAQERTDEVVDPTQVVAVQTQKSLQTTGGVSKPNGVPGTASNTPAVDEKGKAQLPVYPTAATEPQSAQQESSTYAVTKHTTHEEQAPGRIARVTAAILINDRSVVQGSGKSQHTVWKPRTADEMKRLEELAQAAVGFDTRRGDSVVLQNIGFSSNDPQPVVSGMDKLSEETQSMLRSQPELLRMVGFGLLALFLMMFVVRPVAKTTMTILEEVKALPAPMPNKMLPQGGLGEVAQLAAETAMGNAPRELMAKSSGAALDAEGVLEYVAAHVRREPQQSTRLLETWIGSKERAV
jgi:flagellar M-ring protein FliF